MLCAHRPGRAKTLAFAAAAVMLGGGAALSLVEVTLRLVQPVSTGYLPQPPNVELTFQTPHQEGVKGPSLFKTNSLGVRGREWSRDRRTECRILCLGGSTTECLTTHQERVWTALLEEELGVLPDGRRAWVGNAGKSGIASPHHLLQLRRLLPLHDPDYVVVLVGVNDLGSRLKRGESYAAGQAAAPEAQPVLLGQAFSVQPGLPPGAYPDDSGLKATRLWVLLRRASHLAVGNPESQELDGRHLKRWREFRARGKRSAVLPPLEAALDEYQSNLEEMVRLIQAQGARPVMLTQPVLWRAGLTEEEKSLLWAGGVGDYKVRPGCLYYEPEAMESGMNAYNERLIEVCRRSGCIVVDLARGLPRTTEYFYDDCHFTDRGQARIAEVVAGALQPSLKRSPPRGR